MARIKATQGAVSGQVSSQLLDLVKINDTSVLAPCEWKEQITRTPCTLHSLAEPRQMAPF